MSLLTTFIENKIKDYQEPTRKGTPKGEPIGFSKKKFAAALTLISNVYMYTFGDDLEVDYQVLRKWNTEEKFKKLTNKMALECAAYIAAWITDKVDKCKTPKEWQELLFEPLNDMDRYGDTLLSHLKRRLSPRKQRGSDNKIVKQLGDEWKHWVGSTDFVIHFDIKNSFYEILDWVFSHSSKNLGNFRPILENAKLLLKAKEMTEAFINKDMDDEMQDQLMEYFTKEFMHHLMSIWRLISPPVGPASSRKIKIDLDSA